MTLEEEIYQFMMDVKRRRLEKGESAHIIIGEMAANLLMVAHLLCLRIGLSKQDIIDHLQDMEVVVNNRMKRSSN